MIESEAREFYHYGKWKSNRPFPTAQDLNEGLKRELENHPDENKMIYLKELINLLDVDAQEHQKTCKKKDNPSECPSHQFYVKSTYYVNQHIDTYSENLEATDSKYELDHSLSSETIKRLESLLNEERISLHKTSHREIRDIFEKLENLGLLTRERNKYTVSLKDRKHLKKLIELGSWKEFSDWLDMSKDKKQSTTSIINNHFGTTTIGQVNQVIGGGSINKPINKSKKPSKIAWLQILAWLIGIVVGAIGIYEFVIKQFIK